MIPTMFSDGSCYGVLPTFRSREDRDMLLPYDMSYAKVIPISSAFQTITFA